MKASECKCCECGKQAVATPKDITPDGADPLEHVKLTFDELWDELQDELFRLSDMYLIEMNKEHIDNGED